VRISDIELVQSPSSPDFVRVQARVAYDDDQVAPELYWFEYPASCADAIRVSGNPWVLVMLPLASSLGEELRVDRPVDEALWEGAQSMMEAWRYWYPNMKVVPIEAERERPESSGRGVGQFFSGGVDSFFTAVRYSPDHPLRADTLMLAHGFDISIHNQEAFTEVRDVLRRAAEGLGRHFLTVATNIRTCRFGTLDWGTLGHGVGMGSAGLHLAGMFDRILIPSTDGYREHGPWGSHVFLDHHMSTSTLHFIHDGPAATRLDKTKVVVESPVALSSLRVCWEGGTSSNCGECEKCIRTMVALELLGALEPCTTFEANRVDVRKVARIDTAPKEIGPLRLYYQEMLIEARQRGKGDLAKALDRSLRRSARNFYLRRAVKRVAGLPGLSSLVPHIRRLLDR